MSCSRSQRNHKLTDLTIAMMVMAILRDMTAKSLFFVFVNCINLLYLKKSMHSGV